jgi:cytoskeletal protein CcmA (bactofilin family)
MESRGGASMNSRDIRIAEDGVLSGTAAIDVAEVHDTFEGELIARKRPVVYLTGRFSGTIHYGAMMMEKGDIISDNVAMRDAAPARAKVQALPRPVEANAEAASNLEQLPSARGLAGDRAS